jgi:hypothetical protein
LTKDAQKGREGCWFVFDVLVENGQELLLEAIGRRVVIFLVSAEVRINDLF